MVRWQASGHHFECTVLTQRVTVIGILIITCNLTHTLANHVTNGVLDERDSYNREYKLISYQ